MHFFTMALAMIAAFGSWKSPITSDLIVQETIGFSEMQADERGLYWTEHRPKEKGRLALMCYDKQKQMIPLLDEINVRTRVHEYGGGAFSLWQGNFIFSNDADCQLYKLEKNGTCIQLTYTPDCRYADGDGLIWVCEKHDKEAENFLVRIDDGKVETLAQGHDFYSSPRLSPDGKKLAFITWDFPNMQWDGATLWLADLGEDGQLHNLNAIAGGPHESICQVQWSPEGILHFVSDRTGFLNLYRLREGQVENLYESEAEFGIPAWVFGLPTYTFLSDGKIICSYIVQGVDHLGCIDPEKKTLQDLGQPFTTIHNLVSFQDKVYFFGASPTLPRSLICLDPKTKQCEVLKQSFSVPMGEEWISKGELIEFPSQGGKKAYGFYYPPKNPNFEAPEGEKPPLIVKVHGGPTSQSHWALNLTVQYWTSRGFGVVDVNYGGSTGYGREYLKRLEENWGILDVEDCVNAVQFLVDKGLADENRLLIRGGSAGGYTVLASLTFKDIFAAGTSYYGVSDLELLYKDTHKFEAKYTDILVAPYPERVDLIRDRSPIHHIEELSKPVLLLQGEEDKIVPPNQTFEIYEGLKKRGTPVGMILFEGEGHGFRQAPNIKRALDAELYFYSKILGIELAEPFEELPVPIVGIE